MNKLKIFSIIFIFCLTISNIYGQKVIEGTVHSIINDNVIAFVKVEAFYKDIKICEDDIYFQGILNLILPDTLLYIKLKFSSPNYIDNDTIIYFKDNDTIRGKFYVGNRIPKWDLIFNENDAKRDILEGNIKLYIPAFVHNKKKLDKLTNKYGFRYICINDECIDQNIIESAYRYNKVVIEYLDKIYYNGWQNDLKMKISKYIISDYFYSEDIWGRL